MNCAICLKPIESGQRLCWLTYGVFYKDGSLRFVEGGDYYHVTCYEEHGLEPESKEGNDG